MINLYFVDLTGYSFTLLFLIFSIVVAVVIYVLSYLLIPKAYDTEKLSAYECGFDPFSDSRSLFDVRFYLVSILFIVFDLEVTFLFPWVAAIEAGNLYGFVLMVIFLFVLTVGFIYEWARGALEWE